MKRRPRQTYTDLNRPDWRDPNMPVYRNYRMANGELREQVDPDYERRYREHLQNMNPAPTFRNDPTYNLRRRRHGH